MLLPLWRYTDFHGRSRRLEVVSFAFGLLLLAALTALFTLGAGAGHGEALARIEMLAMAGLFASVFGATLIIPTLALQVRRLHDLNLSGWWLLVDLLPYVGWAAMLVLLLLPGSRGANRFGADPRDIGLERRRAG
ncbi:MAG: hypothetical protein A4S12_00445 [Proteobacteria bacterium SG_bin5]|nr:MAG: hypothetical protein A4S12_00445 [Proteobacteria bacterium SG_bin5]